MWRVEDEMERFGESTLDNPELNEIVRYDYFVNEVKDHSGDIIVTIKFTTIPAKD